MAAQPVYGAPISAPAHDSASVGTGVSTQIEGDVVEAQGADVEAVQEAVTEAVTEAAAEVVE